MTDSNSSVIPFSALIGLNDAKFALILAIIDPRIGGVLISGPKGTGKSTLVRSLYSILPSIEYIKDCSFKCLSISSQNICDNCKQLKEKNQKPLQILSKKMDIITLPLGATEDRVIGCLDIEKIIGSGIEALSPGILASANQEILYIDEINLLPDHLVDTILDCSVSGWNIVERENISIRHPSRFVLVGTMNPEEGNLRPQLLDRLSLYAEAGNLENIEDRIRVVEINLDLESGSQQLINFNHYDKGIEKKIEKARNNLSSIQLSSENKKMISELCLSLKVDGFR